MACNLNCLFCFSKSSISTLRHDSLNWQEMDIRRYYEFARERGAERLVITGGGEPLLRPQEVLYLIQQGRDYFNEITCFTNGSFLSPELAQALAEAGVSYLCYSRHHHEDEACRALMGQKVISLEQFFKNTGPLKVRAICVMCKEYIDNTEKVWQYIRTLQAYGVEEFTFKHTYVTYEKSVFKQSDQNHWAQAHQIEYDPFAGEGEVVDRLPWGPEIRRIGGLQVCYYHEPTPVWELENRLCRSSNLLSDGTVYASLEDQRSRLYQLSTSPPRSRMRSYTSPKGIHQLRACSWWSANNM
jgi:cyclic pyranopterin phosphate synthase